MFRRAMKRAVSNTMRIGAEGIKIKVGGPPEWRRDRPQRVVPRGPRAAAYAARRHRLRHCRGQHHLRRHRRQGVDIQGRDHRPGRGRPRRQRRARLLPDSGELFMLQPKRTKFRKQHEGPQPRSGAARQQGQFRRVRSQGHRPRPHDLRARSRRPGVPLPGTSSAAASCGSACSRMCLSPRSRSRFARARARATWSTGLPRSSRAAMLYEIEGVYGRHRA